MSSSQIRKTGAHLGPVARWFGRTVARLLNWKVEGQIPPDVTKAIFVASPHTSNWDGFYMQVCAWALGVRLSWMTKHTMFRWPIGWFIRWAGGVAVDRSKRSDTVQQIAEQFQNADELYLAIAPSGTRAKRDYWKSGFYHIARAANVPLICGFLDFKRRAGGVGDVFMPTGDIKADMDRLRAFYEGIEGRHPENHTRVRLRVEDESDEASEAS